MPSGTTHTRVELWLLPGFAALGILWGEPSPSELVLFALSYLGSSLLLSPDLDLDANVARRRWGPLAFLWTPYARVFAHRGLSHHWALGPLTRLGYLALILGITITALSRIGLDPPPGLLEAALRPRTLIALGAGLYLPHLLHIVLDRATSAARRRRRAS